MKIILLLTLLSCFSIAFPQNKTTATKPAAKQPVCKVKAVDLPPVQSLKLGMSREAVQKIYSNISFKTSAIDGQDPASQAKKRTEESRTFSIPFAQLAGSSASVVSFIEYDRKVVSINTQYNIKWYGADEFIKNLEFNLRIPRTAWRIDGERAIAKCVGFTAEANAYSQFSFSTLEIRDSNLGDYRLRDEMAIEKEKKDRFKP